MAQNIVRLQITFVISTRTENQHLQAGMYCDMHVGATLFN